MKKAISVLLCLCLALSVFTVVPFAASAAEVTEGYVGASSGTTGDCTWTLNDNGTLTISGNGAIGNYSIKELSNIYRTTAPWGANIKALVIEDGVTSIGVNAFYGCKNLTSVTIGNSVTSIGYEAFFNCTGLTSVTIPDSVTSINSSTFGECTGLKSVTIPDSVRSIGEYAFRGCTGLTSVTIPDRVTSIGDEAFGYCSGLTSVTIPDSVTSIGEYAFYNCTGLTSVHISDIAAWCNIAFLGDGSNPLYYAHNLYLNDVPVTDLIIPDSVTSIGDYAFSNCTCLTSVTIPDSVTSIGGWAFEGCTGLTSTTIPDSVTSIGSSAFSGTTWYNNQPNGLVYAGKVAYKYKGTMPANTSITLQAGTKGISGFAFYNCTGLTSVTIPDSVTSIGEYAFYGCSGLTSVTIPDSVTSIGNRALGHYYDNGDKKVAGFTIYGKRGSEAQRYANDYRFIFEELFVDEPTTEAFEETTCPVEETTEAYEETTAYHEETTVPDEATTCGLEYCMVSGMSNFCQTVVAREIEVGDTVAVTFKALEDVTIVDVQWGLIYDDDMLDLTGINSFDNEKMLVDPNDEYYNLIGSYSNISTPASVAKDGELVTFNFTVKQSGETTVDLNVVDMTIRIYGEDQIRVENGEIKNICTHTTTRTIPGYPATCTQAGLTDEIVCAECEKVLTKAVVIPAKGHTPVVDQAKAATCTETGLTEGSHCSVCNEVLVEQTEIPALGHLPIIDPYLAPTCTHEGHTIGSYCERCGEVYVASETIPKIPHTVVVDEAVEPSCGHTGLTEGSHCSVCGEVIVAQEVIPALTHQYEIVPAVPATYTKEGSTDGVRCKLCGEWLIEPQATPKKTIDFTFGDVNEDGKVNIRDVTAVQRFLAEYTDLTERQRGAADVNFDGVVDVRDATLLQMYFAEFDVQLG